MSALHIDTPLLPSQRWQSSAGHPILFKMDALQPSGSFKLRGIGLFCQQARARGATALLCASGGNAGFAAAYAGRRLGMPVTIVVPETTTSEARDAIAAAGATVIVHGRDFDAASVHANALASEVGAAYIHPFDDPLLWQGHATIIDEIVAARAPVDCIVTSVGGGGLMLGLIEGLKRHGLSDIPIIAVETEGAASLHASIAAGEVVSLDAITSIATSLGARRVADQALAALQSHPVISVLVSDAEAVTGCIDFADAHRVLVEPACGAAIAALDVHRDMMARFKHPLVEICGGIGVSMSRLAAWRKALAI